MSLNAEKAPSGRKPRTPARTAPALPMKKVALQLKLRPETKLWLETQALGRGTTVSQLVEELVANQPAGYTLHRPRSPGAPPEPLPGQLSLLDDATADA